MNELTLTVFDDNSNFRMKSYSRAIATNPADRAHNRGGRTSRGRNHLRTVCGVNTRVRFSAESWMVVEFH